MLPCIPLSHFAVLFIGTTVLITITRNKCFGMANTGKRRFEENTTVAREGEATSVAIHITHEPQYRSPNVKVLITETSKYTKRQTKAWS
jgi:hypothetical protein